MEAGAAGARLPAVAGLLPEAPVIVRKPALPVVAMARRLARDASRAVELVVFAVCTIAAALETGAPVARLPVDLDLLPEALVIICKPALPVVAMARRLARDASRAVELVVFAVCTIAAALEAGAPVARLPADWGLLPEALVIIRKPALPVVAMARRLARDASRAVELVVFALCTIAAALEAGAPVARLPADLGLLPEALVIICKPALPLVDIARRLTRDASRAV
ncbi:hypothetical protein NB231_15158 [Nitrococcus mobilis Nb-231]|uniref:Uncharacterized protein n=2 Tax=Nitrococcus mobilis TaxID=35797 RepID=A4BLI2_9GAMM|nr:hypothetical protein NB231_15158 [Nitrococcus mobilis Nb-231]